MKVLVTFIDQNGQPKREQAKVLGTKGLIALENALESRGCEVHRVAPINESKK